MKYDPKKRRYVDDDGRVIPVAQVRAIVNKYIQHEQKIVGDLATQVLEGAVTVEAFFAVMKQKVTAWHSITGQIAYGGEDQMNAKRWKRINERITSELTYLEGFQAEAEASVTAVEIISSKVARSLASQYPDATASIQQSVSRALMSANPSDALTVARQAVAEVVGTAPDITLGPESGFLMGAQIEPRSEMYADAMWATHETQMLERERDNGVNLGRRLCEKDEHSCDECDDAATDEFVPLDELPEIGSLQCLTRCRCEFEFQVEGVEFATSDVFQGVIGGQDAFGGSVTIQ